MPIQLKRVYEKASADDGKRILVERLWPRGLKKQEARVDEWLRDIAPSPELRKWFAHDPAKWPEFKQRYWKELDEKKTLVSKLAAECRARKVTFLFASKEQVRNSSMVLKEYIEKLLK